MQYIGQGVLQSAEERSKYRKAPRFVPAGQSTQMIIGATPESDLQIITLSEALYKKFSLKRVFYSAYVPVGDEKFLPSKETKPPLLREHRLYQADWLLRFYGFEAKELLDEKHSSFNPLLDPKCNWAVNHPEFFPVEINKAPYELLLRIPGVGVNSARRIMMARRTANLNFKDLKKLGVVLKRAQYFILCNGKMTEGLKVTETAVMRELMSASVVKKLDENGAFPDNSYGTQISFFDNENKNLSMEDKVKCLTGQM